MTQLCQDGTIINSMLCAETVMTTLIKDAPIHIFFCSDPIIIIINPKSKKIGASKCQ